MPLILSFSVTAFAENGNAAGGNNIIELADGKILPGGVFNVLTYASPSAVRLGDSGLKEAGLTAGPFILKSDEIRIFSSREASNAAPLARIWLNASKGGGYWFQTGGEGSADDFVIPEGAMVVVWTRASAEPVMWTSIFE